MPLNIQMPPNVELQGLQQMTPEIGWRKPRLFPKCAIERSPVVEACFGSKPFERQLFVVGRHKFDGFPDTKFVDIDIEVFPRTVVYRS